ncbi:hypothetical protein FB45DRAFT_1008597 [Roridomyces roridus]|uniref:HRDC domain-containing protein n=1 Tax=Roridomyces roridus TaxID=1738132 RepID=A0AAD7B9K6_9AGAR|nr:hypothetical protein FB45DRAFT_1008597 [Roridomyces roridus]
MLTVDVEKYLLVIAPECRRGGAKTGVPSVLVQEKLNEWRTRVKKRDFKNALWSVEGLLQRSTMTLLSSVGPIEDRAMLELVLGGQWKWMEKYGDELLECLKAIDMPPFQAKPKATRKRKALAADTAPEPKETSPKRPRVEARVDGTRAGRQEPSMTARDTSRHLTTTTTPALPSTPRSYALPVASSSRSHPATLPNHYAHILTPGTPTPTAPPPYGYYPYQYIGHHPHTPAAFSSQPLQHQAPQSSYYRPQTLHYPASPFSSPAPATPMRRQSHFPHPPPQGASPSGSFLGPAQHPGLPGQEQFGRNC